jgi:hypothetical protein
MELSTLATPGLGLRRCAALSAGRRSGLVRVPVAVPVTGIAIICGGIGRNGLTCRLPGRSGCLGGGPTKWVGRGGGVNGPPPPPRPAMPAAVLLAAEPRSHNSAAGDVHVLGTSAARTLHLPLLMLPCVCIMCIRPTGRLPEGIQGPVQ